MRNKKNRTGPRVKGPREAKRVLGFHELLANWWAYVNVHVDPRIAKFITRARPLAYWLQGLEKKPNEAH
jgi:hypothetical protein